jgi:hypothetical protein
MIVRRQHTGRYASLPNAIWDDPALSVETKGTLGYLLSRPHNWHVSLRQVGKKLGVGKDRLHRIFNELIAAGYASREQRRDVRTGAFGRFEYVIRDEPEVGVASLPQPEEPAPAEPAPANQVAYINKTESTKTESTNPFPQTPCPSAPRLAKKGLGNERDGSRSEHPSIVQARVAGRLGQGDKAEGWLLFGALSDSKRDELTAQERNGRLSDAALTQVLLNLRAG